MADFDIGETIICSIEIGDDTGTLVNPSGDTQHVKITITDKQSKKKVDDVAMDNDGVGRYHYDCQTEGYTDGKYEVKYVAIDGTRITIEKETFTLS